MLRNVIFLRCMPANRLSSCIVILQRASIIFTQNQKDFFLVCVPSAWIRSTCILPSVMVPVLSRHRVSTRASVSMQYSSCTSVLRFARLMEPTASATLVSKTRPSGITTSNAATVDTIACGRGLSQKKTA